jgi:uncharacterized SAM-binding protein YcdF (DUF218 family)
MARMLETRCYRFIGLIGIGLLALSAFTPLPNTLRRWLSVPAKLESAEVIVVLGAGTPDDGILSSASLRRALAGVLLYRQGFAPRLLFSGPGQHGKRSEAEVRSDLARALGIAPEAILLEDEARTTREEAVRIGTRLGALGLRRILLVTDGQHLRRAQPLFERAGIEVSPVPADDISPTADSAEGRLGLIRLTLEELLALLYYRVSGYL